MGFTWEHDAHLYLRRALTLRQLAGPPSALRVEATRAALEGSRRRLVLDLPEDAERVREEVRAVVAEVAAAPDSGATAPAHGRGRPDHAALARALGTVAPGRSSSS